MSNDTMSVKLSWGTIVNPYATSTPISVRMGPKRMITINASKLAACAGMHKFSPQSDIRHEMAMHFGPILPDEEEDYEVAMPYIDPIAALHADLTRLTHDDEERARLHATCTASYADATSVGNALKDLKAYAITLPDSTRQNIASAVRCHTTKCFMISPDIEETDVTTDDVGTGILNDDVLKHMNSAVEELVREERDTIDQIMSTCLSDDERRAVRDVFMNVTKQGYARLKDFGWKNRLTRTEQRRRNEITARVKHICERIDSLVDATCQQQSSMPESTIELARHVLYTRHGNEQEPHIRDKINSNTLHEKKQFCTTNEFRKRQLLTLSDECGTKVFIGGRHDGINSEGKIVEIKTRQSRFLGVPKYERIQVMAYMYIFGTNIADQEATLVESYNGTVRSHEIEWDDNLWTEVKDAVNTLLLELLSVHLS